MSKNEIEDTKYYFDYIEFLCKYFNQLKSYNIPTSQNFIKEQHKKTYTDFFLDNLFLFHKATLDKNNIEIINFYNSLTSKLYHYTNFVSLEKIIAGKSLKLNTLSNMNDDKEGLALCEYLQNRYKDNPQLNEWLKKTIELVPEYNSKIFSFSFSFLKDDAPQWERYGGIKNISSKEPCGVCLEIDKQKFEEYLKEQESCFDMLDITPVLYVPHNGKDNTFLEMAFVTALASMKSKHPNVTIPSLNDDNIKQALAKEISYFSADIKHDSFKNEREMRLIASLNDKTPECYTYGSIFLNLASKEPNIKLSDIITSITISRRAYKTYKPKVMDLLKAHNINVNFDEYIKESNCPLR